MRLPDPEEQPTLTIPEAGRMLGLSRAAAYRAAQTGYLPTIEVSERRRMVPTAALRLLLQVDR